MVIVFYSTVTTATNIAIIFSSVTAGELLLSKDLIMYKNLLIRFVQTSINLDHEFNQANTTCRLTA